MTESNRLLKVPASKQQQHRDVCPVYPGEKLRELLKEMDADERAEALGELAILVAIQRVKREAAS